MRRSSIILALMALVGCGRPAELSVDHAWVRLAAAPGRPAGGYFTLHGGPAAAVLTAVSSPAAGRIELHETMEMDAGKMGTSAMTMRPLDRLAVPAADTVIFTPGGRHLMLFDVAAAVKPGAKLPLTFAFANGAPLTVQASVIAAGDPAPAP